MKLTYENVRGVLRECGPLTLREVAQFFPDQHRRNVGSILSRMRHGLATKQVYVYSWTREGIGKKYLRAIYALGDKRDAKKPPAISESERKRTWRQKKKVLVVGVNSVFALSAYL